FTKNNARIIYLEDLQDLPHLGNVVINPDLTYVNGIAPHYWKYEGGVVLPMTEEERLARDVSIQAYGADCDISLEALRTNAEERGLRRKKALELQEAKHQALCAQLEGHDHQLPVLWKELEKLQTQFSTQNEWVHRRMAHMDTESENWDKVHQESDAEIHRRITLCLRGAGILVVLQTLLYGVA